MAMKSTSGLNTRDLKVALDDWRKGNFDVMVAKASNIDKTQGTFTATGYILENVMAEVRVTPVLDPEQATGMKVWPKDGSDVIVAQLHNQPDQGVLLMAYEIDEVIVDADLITFNQGSNGGLINISDLVNKLNALESWARNMETVFNAHTHPETGATTSPPNPPPAPTGPPDTTIQDLEDDKIVH